MNIEPSVKSIARHYSGLIDLLIVDKKDKGNLRNLDSISVIFESIFMKTKLEKINLENKNFMNVLTYNMLKMN